MRLADIIRMALTTIMAYRQRSLLTIAGILVGIASVVLLTSIGEGVRVYVLNEFTQFGTNLVAVTPGKATTFGVSGATISTVRPLTLDDAEALTRMDHAIEVVPLVQGNASVEFRQRQRRTMVFGVGSGVPEVWKMPVASGRFLPDDGYRNTRNYAVLGAKMRDELFGTTNPLGKRIRVGGDRYRIVGVMARKGQMLGFDLDDTIFIPVNKTLEMFNREGVMEIDILYESGVSSTLVESNIERILTSRHGDEDFTITTQDKMLEVLDTILNVLTLGVAAIGGISLVVGAIGIMTIMTIAVTERTAEIGLLSAIGANRHSILQLFLGEAIVLSGIGGVLGASLAILLVFTGKLVAPALPLEIAWHYVLLALALALVIGLLSGIFPAIRAASMQPLEALRTE